MISGVLQRLYIMQQTEQRLVLREFPLLEWLLALGLCIGAINMRILGLDLTAIAAVFIALVLVLISRGRDVVFDVDSDEMIISYWTLIRQRAVNVTPLAEITRAYLKTADDGATQIILVSREDEHGLSVYSRDLRPWKETLVFSINELLHNARIQRQKADERELDAIVTS